MDQHLGALLIYGYDPAGKRCILIMPANAGN